MSSPFKTHQEFLNAKGPIYSFGNSPAIIGILLAVSAILFLWFIYASYTIKSGKPAAKNPVILSILIAVSSFSLADIYISHPGRTPSKKGVSEVLSSRQGQGWHFSPMAAVGMMASGSVFQRRRQKLSRSLRKPNSTWEKLSGGVRTKLSFLLPSPTADRGKRRSSSRNSLYGK